MIFLPGDQDAFGREGFDQDAVALGQGNLIEDALGQGDDQGAADFAEPRVEYRELHRSTPHPESAQSR